MKEYIIVDFDGTIYFGDINWTINLCKKISKKYKIILATGRKYSDFKKFFPKKLLSYFDFMIFSNGAIVYGDDGLTYSPIPAECLLILEKHLKGWSICEDASGNKYVEAFGNREIIRVQNFTDNIEDYIWNINLINSMSLQFVSEKLGGISIYGQNVNKFRTSIKRLQDKGGVLTRTIGNDINDVSLFLDSKIKYLNLETKELKGVEEKIAAFLEIDW
ncbi:Cof-like hydrolase [Streptococcus agalactiae]|uniref:HAD hydrolase family protein n=1 Tax=Streptococcus agalactiae TaxID=1311 RepID=UPI00102613B1|nr:HAD hydrolase family protein [Streptococcus agalactiae]VFA68560.1 Cof-like hydrolase [Streptococcus agalactiae]